VQFIFLNTREGREEVIIETVSHHEFTRKSWLERIKELDERIGNNLVYISGGLFEGFVLNKIESGSGYANTFIKKNYHYLFVNRRPVDVQPALLAVLNEIYRKYNSGTRYAFVLNLKLEHQQIDVNLSPNKREVFIRKTALEGIVEQLRREIGLQVGDEVPVLASFQERKSKGSQSAVLGEAREELNEKNSKSPFVSNRA
jgi:DNA mismatch repair ATPase MutL